MHLSARVRAIAIGLLLVLAAPTAAPAQVSPEGPPRLSYMVHPNYPGDVVAFFASDLAKAVTGQHLLVNAGEISR